MSVTTVQVAERTKRCTRCGEVKPWSQYYPLTRWEDGTKRTVRPRCKACETAVTLERRRNDPALHERVKAYHRERHRRVLADPERAAERRDYQRQWYHRTRGNGGEHRRQTVDIGGSSRLPAAPFAEWLRGIEHRYESRMEMADALGTDESLLRRVLSGEKPGVSLDTVDRALLNVGDGTTLDMLYPLEEAA